MLSISIEEAELAVGYMMQNVIETDESEEWNHLIPEEEQDRL